MLELTFISESEIFESATNEYRNIWIKEKSAILRTFEEVTGLKFQQKEIDVVVYEGPSFSGKLDTPMKLRASYPYEIKLGTLLHELGHRLIAPLDNKTKELDEHQILNLFLYDVWTKLYGKEFADRMVLVESNRKGLYDYKGTWDWFLTLSSEEKNSLWKQFLSLNANS